MFQEKTYPNIAQSWGIMGVAIVSMLVFTPLQIALINVLGKELSLLVYYLVSMGAALSFAHFIRKKETSNNQYDISFSTPKIIILVSFGALGLQLGILSPITSLIPMPDLFKQIFLEIGEMNGFFAFLMIVVAAPIFEEFIFRGVMLDGLLKKYSPAKSIFISSLLFGIVHLNPWQFITAMGIGAFIGWVYYKTHKLSLCIIIHFANNLFAFLSMQSVILEEEIEKSFVESHGGYTNAVMVIIAGIVVFSTCIKLLYQEFEKRKIESIENASQND